MTVDYFISRVGREPIPPDPVGRHRKVVEPSLAALSVRALLRWAKLRQRRAAAKSASGAQ